jgi:hypothetical protein
MTETAAPDPAGRRQSPGRPPFVAIGALARLIIQARCALFPDETPRLIRSVELYATRSNNLPVPLPAQGARPQMTGHIGRWHSSIGDEFYHGHIDRGPFLIGEGRITISEGTIPRATWNALVSGRRDGQPISTLVDLGPGHDAPIEDVTLVKDSSVERAVITFDNRPMRWAAFKADLLARHQTGDPVP